RPVRGRLEGLRGSHGRLAGNPRRPRQNRRSKGVTAMASRFVYVTYIRSTPEKVWEALIKPEFTRQYWFGAHAASDWQTGSSWTLFGKDGKITDSGEVLEIDPPRRLVLKWRNEFVPEMKAEG